MYKHTLMTSQEYIELERKVLDRRAKAELALKACAELVEMFPTITEDIVRPAHSPLFPAYHLARQALGLEPR